MNMLESLFSFPSPGQHLCGLAWDGSHLWHSDAGEQQIYRIDPATGKVVNTIPCPGVQTGLAFDGRYLWQVVDRPKAMRCLDFEGRVIQAFTIKPETEHACGIEMAGDDFWLSLEGEGRLQLRSLADGQVRRDFPVAPHIAGICLADGRLWYAVYQDQLLVAINPETGTEQGRYRVAGHPTGLAWDGQHLWYADYDGKQIRAVQPLDTNFSSGGE